MITVYGDLQSGNCYKIKLLLELLSIEHEWIHVDILKGETRTDEFLALNFAGQIPLLLLGDGRTLSESNAILNYLAHGSQWLSEDPYELALIQKWQFFEQYSHEPYIAVARFINKYLGLPDDRRDEYEAKQKGGHRALAIMEHQLKQTLYLAGDKPTTADISLYAYTHVAHEGGFELSSYPAIGQWIDRMQNLPNYIGME